MMNFFLSLICVGILFADYTKEIDKITGKLAKEIPENKTVVVFNILKDGKEETENSVDLAIKLGMKLADKAKKRFVVLDRSAGEKLAFEERKYTVADFGSSGLKKLLEGFKADIGVVGQYQLLGKNLIIENIRAVRVPSPESPPEVIASYERLSIKLNTADSLCLIQKENILPQQPDSITNYFLSANTNNDFISIKITNLEGIPLTDNCARLGESYRLHIDLTEDLFLYCFSYDEDNNTVYLLHPLNKENDIVIKKGTFLIPQGDYALEAKPPAGRNFIKVFASRKPILIDIPQAEDNRLTGNELARFVKALKNSSPIDWSSERIFLHIVESNE